MNTDQGKRNVEELNGILGVWPSSHYRISSYVLIRVHLCQSVARLTPSSFQVEAGHLVGVADQ